MATRPGKHTQKKRSTEKNLKLLVTLKKVHNFYISSTVICHTRYIMSQEKILPIFAIIVLIIGVAASVFVYATETQNASETTIIITINGNSYTIPQLMTSGTYKTISTDDGEKAGVALDQLIIRSDVECPSCHDYTIKAKDMYQQTITWENVQQGIFTDDARVYFPNLAHTFWVNDVRTIEVV
jgi:hypothetical protein